MVAAISKQKRFSWKTANPYQKAKEILKNGDRPSIARKTLDNPCILCEGPIEAGDSYLSARVALRNAHESCVRDVIASGKDKGHLQLVAPAEEKRIEDFKPVTDSKTSAEAPGHSVPKITDTNELYRYIGTLEGKIEMYEGLVKQLLDKVTGS